MDLVIIGAGRMGALHAQVAHRLGDRIVGVVDPDAVRAGSLAAEVGARSVYPDLPAALGEVDFDAAVIASPSVSHLADATRMVEAGKHVLVEKPHRLPGQDASTLKDALTRNPQVRYQVGMSNRFRAGVVESIEAVQSGELGEIVSWEDRTLFRLRRDSLASWYFDSQASGGGVSVTNGVHSIDLVLSTLGSTGTWAMRSASVFANHDGEDIAHLSATARGAAVSVLLVWADWDLPPSELLVVGTRGTASVRSGSGWTIETASASRSGEEEPEESRFLRQWRTFQTHVAGGSGGPTFEALEPVIEILTDLRRGSQVA